MLAILSLPLAMLGFTAVAVVLPDAVASIANAGPHGFSEILYAYTSAAANNGSAFGGLTGNTPWYNLTLGIAMLIGPLPRHRPGAGHRRLARGQEDRPGLGRHVPDPRRALRRPARRRHPDRRRPHLLPGARPRPRRRASGDARRPDLLIGTHHVQTQAPPCSRRRSSCPRWARPSRKLDPRQMIRNPVMFVVEVVALLTTVLFLRDLGDRRRRPRLQLPDHPLAVVHGPLRQLRRGGGRGARQGAGRRACARRAPTTPAKRLLAADDRERLRGRPGRGPRGRRPRAGRGRRRHPRRRRGDRGRRLGQRGGDHRRIRPGDPRVRRRPLGRHRRHHGDLRLADQSASPSARGNYLPRPDDRAGRGRGAAEDAERDRAQHPARRADDHLRLRRRLDPELRRLCRRHDRR